MAPASGPVEWSSVVHVLDWGGGAWMGGGGAQTEMDQGPCVWINRVRLIASAKRGHYSESTR